mgnify:CR=1 FL=1
MEKQEKGIEVKPLTVEEIEELVNTIANSTDERVPDGVGFAVMLFEFGKGGHMAYASNGRRQDMIRALQELLGKLQSSSVPHAN